MDWLKQFFSHSASPKGSEGDQNALWLYVQCQHCGTPLAVRIDRRNEISRDFEGGGMILRKEMMDNVCFQLMRAEIIFGEGGDIKQQTVDRGRFLTREEYELIRKEKT